MSNLLKKTNSKSIIVKIMKKLGALFIFPMLLSGVALSSCSNNSKINLLYGDVNETSYIDIKYLDLKSKIDNEETFMLAVEPNSACSCWSDFRLILNDYIPKTHVMVYHMKYAMFYEQETYGLNLRDGYTTFAIFDKGELKQNIISDNQSMFHDQKVFEDYMSNTVNMPHYLYANLDTINNLYKASEPSIIYFARNTCSDCQYVDKYFLKDYADKHVDRKDMYILDCEKLGIRQYDEDGHLTPESQILWNEFKANIGIAELYNPDYGYSEGVVPTFMKVHGEDGVVKYDSSSVYFNDEVSEVDGKLIVSNSFYSEERLPKLEYLKDFNGTKVLKGLELTEDDVQRFGPYVMWKQEKAAEYHSPLLEQFLNYYL